MVRGGRENGYEPVYLSLQNPDYMKDGFHITIETIHVGNDRGKQENVSDLPPYCNPDFIGCSLLGTQFTSC